jgi:hypothetical protein
MELPVPAAELVDCSSCRRQSRLPHWSLDRKGVAQELWNICKYLSSRMLFTLD